MSSPWFFTCSPGKSLQREFGPENALIGLACSARPVSRTPRGPSAAPERRARTWNDGSWRSVPQVSSLRSFFSSVPTLCLQLITRGETAWERMQTFVEWTANMDAAKKGEICGCGYAPADGACQDKETNRNSLKVHVIFSTVSPFGNHKCALLI